MGTFWEKLKALLQLMGERRRRSRKPKSKHGKGFESREAFEAHFKERYGKPGRLPDDVA